MGFRFLPLITGVLVFIAVVLMASHAWAHWYDLSVSIRHE